MIRSLYQQIGRCDIDKFLENAKSGESSEPK